jgi:hypothetical protein
MLASVLYLEPTGGMAAMAAWARSRGVRNEAAVSQGVGISPWRAVSAPAASGWVEPGAGAAALPAQTGTAGSGPVPSRDAGTPLPDPSSAGLALPGGAPPSMDVLLVHASALRQSLRRVDRDARALARGGYAAATPKTPQNRADALDRVA